MGVEGYGISTFVTTFGGDGLISHSMTFLIPTTTVIHSPDAPKQSGLRSRGQSTACPTTTSSQVAVSEQKRAEERERRMKDGKDIPQQRESRQTCHAMEDVSSPHKMSEEEGHIPYKPRQVMDTGRPFSDYDAKTAGS